MPENFSAPRAAFILMPRFCLLVLQIEIDKIISMPDCPSRNFAVIFLKISNLRMGNIKKKEARPENAKVHGFKYQRTNM